MRDLSMTSKRRKTMIDLREFPAALDLARRLYRDNEGHLRQSRECVELGDFLGLSSIAVWHAYHRGDLGVPSPNPQRAEAWAKGEPFYLAEDRPCRRCGSQKRIPGDGVCYNCEQARREAARK